MKKDEFEKIRAEAHRKIAARNGNLNEGAEEPAPKMVVFETVDDLMKSSRKGS
jgi:hypothetical protein